MDRLAGRAVPDDDRLALVGDADAGDARDSTPLGKRLAGDGERVAPDVLRVMLDPAARGIMLLELALRDRDRPRLGIEQDARVEVVP